MTNWPVTAEREWTQAAFGLYPPVYPSPSLYPMAPTASKWAQSSESTWPQAVEGRW